MRALAVGNDYHFSMLHTYWIMPRSHRHRHHLQEGEGALAVGNDYFPMMHTYWIMPRSHRHRHHLQEGEEEEGQSRQMAKVQTDSIQGLLILLQ
jgi:hypothetical protein